jgi:competence protein ComEA
MRPIRGRRPWDGSRDSPAFAAFMPTGIEVGPPSWVRSGPMSSPPASRASPPDSHPPRHQSWRQARRGQYRQHHQQGTPSPPREGPCPDRGGEEYRRGDQEEQARADLPHPDGLGMAKLLPGQDVPAQGLEGRQPSGFVLGHRGRGLRPSPGGSEVAPARRPGDRSVVPHDRPVAPGRPSHTGSNRRCDPPATPAVRAPASGRPTATAKSAGTGLVNLNTATPAELEALPGIGPTLALRIIAGRPYRSVEDLGRVKGIGPATLAKLRGRVSAE